MVQNPKLKFPPVVIYISGQKIYNYLISNVDDLCHFDSITLGYVIWEACILGGTKGRGSMERKYFSLNPESVQCRTVSKGDLNGHLPISLYLLVPSLFYPHFPQVLVSLPSLPPVENRILRAQSGHLHILGHLCILKRGS